MAIPVTSTDSSKPTTTYSPDTRYALAPISVKYRDYSVNGEMLQDKATGEVFIKRPIDGKVVSYFQNKRYLYEQANELNLVLSSNTDYVYDHVNKSGMYGFVDYDITTITHEQFQNILTTNLVFTEGRYGITFKASVGTNKFIVRLTSRDCDKGPIEYLSALYDDVLENYNGENVILEQEHQMYRTYTEWYYDNVLLNYEVTVTKGDTVNIYSLTGAARLNEASCMDLGRLQIDQDFPDGFDTISVKFLSVDYRKIQFVYSHMNLFGDPETITARLNEMMYQDPDQTGIYVYNCGIGVFTDSIDDVATNPENGTLICLMDTVFTMRYISKMRSSTNGSGILLRIDEPDEQDWYVGSTWAEFCRIVDKDGITTNNNTATTISDLEKFYSKNTRMVVSLTLDSSDPDAIYVELLESEGE